MQIELRKTQTELFHSASFKNSKMFPALFLLIQNKPSERENCLTRNIFKQYQESRQKLHISSVANFELAM